MTTVSLYDKVQAAAEAIHQLKQHPGCANITDIIKLVKLSATLGRLARGRPSTNSK